MGVAGGEGQGEGEHEGTSGYPPVVLEGLEVAGDGLPTGDRAGGRGRAAAAALRRLGEGKAGLGRCSGDEEVDGATGLGRERAEGEVPRWTELGGANGGAARFWARASWSGRPFIGNWVEEGSQDELNFGFEPLQGG
jgi:hypothetical protein